MNYTSLCSTAAFITHHHYHHFWHASLGVNSARDAPIIGIGQLLPWYRLIVIYSFSKYSFFY